MNTLRYISLCSSMLLLMLPCPSQADVSDDNSPYIHQYCLEGEYNLGARLQGTYPDKDEFYPTSWCLLTNEQSNNIQFNASGRSNPDINGSYKVRYLIPDKVVLLGETGNTEFQGAIISNEATRYRRLNPDYIVSEIRDNPDWIVSSSGNKHYTIRYPGSEFLTQLVISDNTLLELSTLADLPLRGRVKVQWHWKEVDGRSHATLKVDDRIIFRGMASEQYLTDEQAGEQWHDAIKGKAYTVPGKAWPSRVAMNIRPLTENTFLLTNVRTGFHHLIIHTDSGLVVADAPAGWVEFTQIPPADLVPGLGVSGLSQMFVENLQKQWPSQALRAVVLTHSHDDHAGGARAFAARGAEIYAHHISSEFLQQQLNAPQMPLDWLSIAKGNATVTPVRNKVVLPDKKVLVELLTMENSPHAVDMLGVYVPTDKIFFVSDIHVPAGSAQTPRKERAQTDCWFASWATSHLPEDVSIWNSHNTRSTLVSDLTYYLADPLCNRTE